MSLPPFPRLLLVALGLSVAAAVGAQGITVRGSASGLPIPPVCQPPVGSPITVLFSGGFLTANYTCALGSGGTAPPLNVSCRPSSLGGSGNVGALYDVRGGSQLSEFFVDCPTAASTVVSNLDVQILRYHPDLAAFENGTAGNPLTCRRTDSPAPGTVSQPSYDPDTRILRYVCTVSGVPQPLVACFTWERDVPRAQITGTSRLSYAADNYTLQAPDCIGFGSPENWAANAPVLVSGVLFADSFDDDAGGTTVTITSFNPDPGVAGQRYTVNVSVTAASGNPRGAVLVSDGTGTTGNCVATLSGSGTTTTGSCELPGVGPGGRTVRATYMGTVGLLGSTTTRQYNVPLGSQTILWNPPYTNPDPLVYAPGGTATLTASLQLSPPGGGGSPLTYTVDSGSTACTVAGNTLTIVAATHNADGSTALPGGPTCVVTANAAGNGSYDPAAPVTRTIVIRQAPQPITFNPPSPLPRFDPNSSFTVQATRSANSSGMPLTFTSLTTGICNPTGTPTQSGNTFTQTVTMTTTRGLCRLRAFQSTGGNPNYVTGQQTMEFTIPRGIQNLIYSGPSTVVFETGGSFQVTVTGGKSSQQIQLYTLLPACSISGTPTHSVLGDGRRRVVATIAMNQTGTCSILADQDEDADFEAALQEFFVSITP